MDTLNSNLLVVLIFGVIVIGGEIFVMIQRQKGWGAQSRKIVGASLIIVAALAITLSNIPIERITSVIGLLGALGGYVVGNKDQDEG